MLRPALEKKAPNESKDYGVDWSPYVDNGTTIISSSWTLPSGITQVTNSVDGLTTVIRLSGGTAGTKYVLENSITTSVGEILIQAIRVDVETPAQIAGF